MEKQYLRQVINYINNTGSLCDKFGCFSKIYNMTTENIYGFLKNYDLKDKRVLTVSGSGDQRLNAYFLGAKNVTCFDINPLTKFHMEMKDKAIVNLNFEKFINFFDIYSRRYGTYYEPLDYRLFDAFKAKLSDETRIFFDYVINSTDVQDYNIYYGFENNLDMLKNANGYLNPDGFDKMKKIMKDKKVEYIETEIEELPYIIKGEKYDMILLSNISDYIHSIYGIDGLRYFRETIDKLADNLELNGVMQVGYIYSEYSSFSDVGDFRFKEERHRYFPSSKFSSVLVDSYGNIDFKDEVITYQKTK